MHELHELKEMLCDELDKITKKGELSAGSLDAVDKLTHSIKSIDTIIAMEGYSEDDMMNNRGGSYARGRKRDSMGRYSRDNYVRGSYNRGGYSRDEEIENLKMELHEILENAGSEEERKMIRRWIKQIEE